MPRLSSIITVAVLMSISLSMSVQAQQQETSEPTAQQTEKPVTVKKKETSIAELEERSRQAFEEENWMRYYGANIRMMNQRPFEPIYMQRVIVACAMLGRHNTAYHYMLNMQQMGLSYDLTKDPGTENLRQTELFTYLNDQMIEAGQPLGEAEVAFTLAEKYSDPSALSWDAGRERFLVGTESDGQILAVSQDGSSEVLIQANNRNGLWAIRGLHADVAANRLWVSSAAVDGFSAYQPVDIGRSALFEFNLETLQIVNRYNVPADGAVHEFGPIAVTNAGDVYIIDYATSRVYRKAANSAGLEVFIGSEEMTALRSIAVEPDNHRLYIGDLYKGVLAIDPLQQASMVLTGPEFTNFGGIVSMSYDQGKLIVIQSGSQPERVVQFGLDASGGNVLTRLPVASAMEQFDNPGLGMVKDELVYYFANLGDSGASRSKGPALVMRSPMPAEEEMPSLNNKSVEDQPQGSR